MNKKLSIIAVLVSLLLPVGTAFAGVGLDIDAQIIRDGGRKVIFAEDDSISIYIHFCGSFSGDLYYGDRLVATDPDLSTLEQNLPLYFAIHFNGAITGGRKTVGTLDHNYCLSAAVESEITILTEEYVVQEGDNLRTILRDQGGSQRDYRMIATFNDIVDPRSLTAGQILVLPIY